MDTPVVLSHQTAWLFYHAPNRHEVLAGNLDYRIDEIGLTAHKIAERIRRFLQDCGVPASQLQTLHILYAKDFMRTRSKSFRPHAFGALIGESSVHELVPGLCVVCEELCFMQAATWMSRFELIEFGYELCGRYELSIPSPHSASYRERMPLTSRKKIQAYVDEHPGIRGAKRAKSALVRVRDWARSPMETATAMAVILNRSEGGLGFRGFDMNYRVEIPAELRVLTTSTFLEIDLYAPRSKTGIEYDGEVHADAAQRARDAERLSTLRAMGVKVHVVTKRQFSEQLSFHRAMNAIARSLYLDIEPTPEFQRAQNELRELLIRDWSA